MNKRVLLAVAITLLLGIAIGFFTAGQLAKRRMDREREFMSNPKSEKMRIMKHMDLSDEQKPVIEPILDTFLMEIRGLRLSQRSDIDSLRAQMVSKIRPHLTDEQHERLEKRRKRNERRRQHRRH